MKQLRLHLKKKIIILERSDNCDITITKEGVYFYLLNKDEKIFIEGKFKLICERGSELTEDIVTELVEGMYPEYYKKATGITQLYKSDTAVYISNPIKAFEERIKKEGYNWGENEFQNAEEYNKALSDSKAWDKRKYSQKRLYFADLPTYKQQMKLYNEAELKTFNPEKSIIFEIL